MSCCENDALQFDGDSIAFRRALWAVIAINATMFVVEMAAGVLADSQALKADALDFAGDTATYTLSLAVVGMPLIRRAQAALLKGLSLGAMGLGVLGFTAYRVVVLGTPAAEVMGAVGILALAANLSSVLLLLKYRNGDANVRSVWLCSRNDAVGNIAVIVASVAVWLTASGWPDLIVAIVIAGLFLKSAFSIVAQALGEMRLAASPDRVTSA
ncbi:MAG: cation transporter [Alphaproteobacteria bacterium]|jgi:Co/Zn/Cd efflux system component|nr:cation transporter [Alphaproteobacteria bacterium]MDP6567127.1 cation transporter [Alphaproteobacteria bacterium]MDP6813965.1 cation transporter [Alphaproteobacteria bacterium]